jgi:hypothetical protein
VNVRAGAPRLLAVLCTLSTGCLPALKEPRPLSDLAGDPSGNTRPVDPEESAALLTRATALFAERSLEPAREAAQMFLRAATADGSSRAALIGAVRAHIWLTDHATDPDERARSATMAVEAAQWCGRRDPADPECDYWLGAALGVQARERPGTALSALPEIETLFRRAAAEIPSVDEAGPLRALALLYLRAPGWPTGPGDPDLGLESARRAVALRPEYPPNILALAEALAATGDSSGSREQYARALELARAAGAGGEPDAAEWILEAERALTGQIR